MSTQDRDLWSDLECSLGNFDIEEAIDYCAIFLTPYGADDWSDADHGNCEYEAEQIVDSLSDNLVLRLRQWIESINVPLLETLEEHILQIEKNAFFLNFNYTPTLQAIYNIDSSYILHIHGVIKDPASKLIVGHDEWAEDKTIQYEPDDDLRIVGTEQVLSSYFNRTYKDCEAIIESNRYFFEQLKNVREVVVLGHSLADADLAYFVQVDEIIQKNLGLWRVSYFDENCRARSVAQLKKIGVSAQAVHFFNMSELTQSHFV